MKKVIIFGTQDTAELAHFYLSQEKDVEVVAFTLHQQYIEESDFKSLPVVPFENLEEHFSTSEFLLFAPMTGRRMNRDRKLVYEQGKLKGYSFYSYISPHATVLTDRIGDNCFILEDNTVQPFVSIGNNVVLWSGNHIGHHSTIEDHVFFTSQVVLSGHCHVKTLSWFGVNATIANDLVIGEGALIAMGAVVNRDAKDWMIHIGSPAKAVKSSENVDF